MENVVTVVFKVESEAYKAFAELRRNPSGKDYAVAEASLLKVEGDSIVVAESMDAGAVTSDDTAAGMLVGSLVGILGGPLGVILGASTGALVGTLFDSADAVDSVSMLEVTAGKLYDGDVAIVALVQEIEPAFDAAFAEYETTIYRHFASDVIQEVDLAREAQADFVHQLRAKLHAERKAEFDEAKDIAEAEYASATKEIFGNK